MDIEKLLEIIEQLRKKAQNLNSSIADGFLLALDNLVIEINKESNEEDN